MEEGVMTNTIVANTFKNEIFGTQIRDTYYTCWVQGKHFEFVIYLQLEAECFLIWHASTLRTLRTNV